MDLRQQVEDRFKLLRCKADAVVTHAQGNLIVLLHELQCDVAAGLGVLGGVLDEVRDDLLQPNRIAVELRRGSSPPPRPSRTPGRHP
jgi:hypothetical protein